MTVAVDEGNSEPQMGYDMTPRGYVRHTFAAFGEPIIRTAHRPL